MEISVNYFFPYCRLFLWKSYTCKNKWEQKKNEIFLFYPFWASEILYPAQIHHHPISFWWLKCTLQGYVVDDDHQALLCIPSFFCIWLSSYQPPPLPPVYLIWIMEGVSRGVVLYYWQYIISFGVLGLEWGVFEGRFKILCRLYFILSTHPVWGFVSDVFGGCRIRVILYNIMLFY